MYRLLLLTTLLMMYLSAKAQSTFTIESPNGAIQWQIELEDKVYHSITYHGVQILKPSSITLQLESGITLGGKPKLATFTRQTIDETVKPLYGKRAEIRNHYREMLITLDEDHTLELRAYDQGVAYRWVTFLEDTIRPVREAVTINFADDYHIWASYPRTNDFVHSYEDFYQHRRLSEMPGDSMAMLPVVVEADSGIRIGITEAELRDYPGLYLRRKPFDQTKLSGVLPQSVLEDIPGGHRNFNKSVVSRAHFLTETAGTRTFPWRVFMLADSDAALLDNDLVYLLSEPAQGDFSWVKPGKVAWDWWNAMNLEGVDFDTGINTETYKYFIDFAAKYRLEYINLDEGWSDQYDLLKVNEAVDVPEIVQYADERGVKVILWCVARVLDAQLEAALDQFETWGVGGIKVDFMDRDDREMVNFYYRVAEAAAKRKLLVNFHGAYKPTGICRTYPNVINFEAVRGLEYNKFAEPDGSGPDHAATIPFIRMLAGYLDYTPGAMINAQKANFNVSFERPMSQGTRCQQLAMYIVYEMPLAMLSDAPTAYEADTNIMKLLGPMPTTWDETQPLAGKIGEYAVLARKKDNKWYVGGLTNWMARDIELDMSFLDSDAYEATIY